MAASGTAYESFEATARAQRQGEEPEPAHEVVVTLDLAGLAGIVDVVLPADTCATAGTTATSSLGEVDHNGTAIPGKVRAASGPRAAGVGTLRCVVTAKDATAHPDNTAATRIRVGTGPDLTVPKRSTVSDARPVGSGGSTVTPAGGTGGSLAATGAAPVRALAAGSAACAALGVLLSAAARRRARTGA